MKKFLLIILPILMCWNVSMAQTGAALYLDGSNDYISIGTQLGANSSYTKEAWVYATNIGGNRNIISSLNNPFWISSNTLRAGNNNNYTVVSDPATFPVSTWTHVAVTYDAATTTMKLYKNGVLVATNTSSPVYVSQNELIGSHNGGSLFVGSIDEVRIWSRALSLAEIQSSMACSILTSGTNLLSNYHFNQGTAGGTNTGLTTLTDASGNGNNGTLTNFNLTGTTSNWVTPGIVASASAGTDVKSACTSYTWIDGNTYTANNNTATYTLTNATGCDSVVTLNLTIGITPVSVTASPTAVCAGNSSTISTASSQAGFNYYLRNDADNAVVAGPVAGTGSALNFNTGALSSTTTYNVFADNDGPSGALDFDGSNDYVNVPTISLPANSDYTIEFWSYVATADLQSERAFYIYGSNIMAHTPWPDQRIYFDDNGVRVDGNYASSMNKWTHIAFVSTGTAGGFKGIYLDGVLVASNPTGSGSNPASTSMKIGAGDLYHKGKIDEFRVWSVKRTQAEIQNSMNSILTGNEPGLIAYYPFENGTGSSIVTDAAGGDNNGTLTNMDPATDWITRTSGLGCSLEMATTATVTVKNPTSSTDTKSACTSYTWIDGNTYTSNNATATHTLTNFKGCDSVVTLNLTIKNATSGTDVKSACTSYTWIDGNTYTSSNTTATHTLTNFKGCDSVVTLNLTIKNATTGTDVKSACTSYTWIDGNTYTSNNTTATHTLTNFKGCDSVVTLNLTIKNATSGTDVKSACTSYTWIDGNTYTSNNTTATHTLTNAAGCDSVVTLNLTIKNATSGTDVKSACTSYTWIDGNTYTSSNTTATHTLTNFKGCDSVVTLNLTIKNATSGTDVKSACTSYTWIDGNTYTSNNTTATHTLTNFKGCDSVVTLNLTIKNATSGTDVKSACTSYTWIDGNTYTSSNTTATHTLTNFKGCDSVVTLNLTIKNATSGTDVQTACTSYTWIDGNTYTSNNATATHTLTNFKGCDSVVTLNLTIKNATTGTDVKSACTSYTWIDGNTYTSSNTTATHTLTNFKGCDSVVTLNLTIKNATSGTDVQTACTSYTWIDGNTYTSNNATATHTLTNFKGCDSVVTLNLTIKNATSGTDVQTACTSYTWIDGNTYTSNNATATHTLTNFKGCDSVVTLNLTIKNATTGTDVKSACTSYTWIDGNTYTSNNTTATYTLTNFKGCDSVVTLNLTIKNATTGTDVKSACVSYTWIDGNTYTSNNTTATHTLTNAAGCDSVVTLNLTIKNATSGTDVKSACTSYTWIDGNTYTSNNTTATHTLTNFKGCDSVVTLNLTIKNATTGTDVKSACTSYTWIDGNTYTSNNTTATHTLTNFKGCDSVVTLNLTIKNATSGTDVQSACVSYTWIDGITYTSDNNTATYTLTNAAGCDSVVTLNLTIKNATSGTDVKSACVSYTWIDGNTYTSNNTTATHTLTNAAGCDSVVTLNLTIKNATSGTDVKSACTSYTWIDGNTYTSNNTTATHTLTNAAGCDSVVTLNLTIKNATTGTDVKSACTSYTWIDGNTYTSNNTTATHTLTNFKGCDSVVTLNLTIKNATSGTDVQTACTSYTWIDGNTYTSSNTTATHTLTNFKGCDSVVTLNLTIKNATTGTDVKSACTSYTWIDGNTYTSNNTTATYTLTNAAGCDSIVTLDLTINSLTATVTQSGNILTADAVGASYQWINCAGNTPVVNATNQSHTFLTNGSYAVIVTENGCIDTSNCYLIISTDIAQHSTAQVLVYPNPNIGTFVIKATTEGTYTIVNSLGQQVQTIELNAASDFSITIDSMSKGVYFIINNKGLLQQKIVVVE